MSGVREQGGTESTTESTLEGATEDERVDGRPPTDEAFAALRASWGFPAFAKRFPRDPALDALVAAFARGDYAAVREGAPKLASTTTSASVREAAETLRARIEPDPTSKILLLVAAALLAFLTLWWVAHDGPDADRSAPTSVERAN